jgi:hypothetical protein
MPLWLRGVCVLYVLRPLRLSVEEGVLWQGRLARSPNHCSGVSPLRCAASVRRDDGERREAAPQQRLPLPGLRRAR